MERAEELFQLRVISGYKCCFAGHRLDPALKSTFFSLVYTGSATRFSLSVFYTETSSSDQETGKLWM
jgi:hypothetical protein